MTSDAASSQVVIRIAVDAMGGDFAPAEIVKGAVLAAKEYPVEILLVGQEEVVRKELAVAVDVLPLNIEVVDAREILGMDDPATAPPPKKRNASVRICSNLGAEGVSPALLSA